MDTYTHRCNSKNTREKVGICYLCKWVHSRALVGIVSMYITDCCEGDIFIILLKMQASYHRHDIHGDEGPNFKIVKLHI